METAAAVIDQDNVAKEYSKKDAISEVTAPEPSVGKETAPTNEQDDTVRDDTERASEEHAVEDTKKKDVVPEFVVPVTGVGSLGTLTTGSKLTIK